MLPYNKSLVANARELRKNMTKEERRLWYDFLKTLPIVVKRQHNIENYIVDFYIPSKKIVIEIDGSQHFEKDALLKDKMRDTNLSCWGIKVIRYTNLDINKRFNAVKEDIIKHLGWDTSSDLPKGKPPSPTGEG